MARDGIHTNSIENFWARLKLSIRGTHIHVSKQHLAKYLGEFAFRYNHRNVADQMFARIIGRDGGMTAAANFTNRTVWTGDNLYILRGLNSASVDLIYLDPPFNSNRTYAAPIGSQAAGAAFKDTWTLSDLDVAWLGLIADEHPALYRVIEAAALTHGKGMQSYLTMMAVRLIELHRVVKGHRLDLPALRPHG